MSQTPTSDWAERINAAWRSSAQGIVEAGRILLDAKRTVRHGEFQKMVESELDFTPSTARRLMIVASDTRLNNRAHGHALPGHWRTLYELTKLDDEAFNNALETGEIHKNMQRKDVPRREPEAAEPDIQSGMVTFSADDPQSMIEHGLACLLAGYAAKAPKAAAHDYAGPLTLAEMNIVWNYVGDFIDEMDRQSAPIAVLDNGK